MEIQLWWTGKTSIAYIEHGVEDYIKRLQHFCKFKICEFKGSKGIQNIQAIQQKEELEFSKKILANDYIVLLDEKGQIYSSIELANKIEKWQLEAHHRIIFIIGGAYGFSSDFKKRADYLLSFSRLTFSHQLIRLIFVEQLYRSYTIIKNIPYHHE